MAEIVNATSAMIAAAHSEPLPRTVRAIAAIEGDRVLGVTGFYPQNGQLVLFAGIAPETRAEIERHKRTLILCARRVMGMVAELGLPACAHADPDIPGSGSLLLHLGFEPIAQGLYTWPGHH